MGLTPSTARYIAPVSFLINFIAQNYGMQSKPNMLDVHNANKSFFSPEPYFILAFFVPQQIAQIAWLYRLWGRSKLGEPNAGGELDEIMPYVPYYAVGNICIAAWMIFWNSSKLVEAHVFVTINTLAQLYFITTKLKPINMKSTSSILTHVVSKTFAGIGVLDLLHNGSVAFFKDYPATLPIRILTGLGFSLAATQSDWIFGSCLVYDLVALAFGQNGSWRNLLGAYAVGTAAIVAAVNMRSRSVQATET